MIKVDKNKEFYFILQQMYQVNKISFILYSIICDINIFRRNFLIIQEVILQFDLKVVDETKQDITILKFFNFKNT